MNSIYTIIPFKYIDTKNKGNLNYLSYLEQLSIGEVAAQNTVLNIWQRISGKEVYPHLLKYVNKLSKKIPCYLYGFKRRKIYCIFRRSEIILF